ncbi:34164_t:CDS:1, partial [Racocetra persica]
MSFIIYFFLNNDATYKPPIAIAPTTPDIIIAPTNPSVNIQ